MMDVAAVYTVIEKTSAAVGKLAALKTHLKAKPHVAAAALAGCLAEVHRTYLAVSSEIVRLTVLSAPGALDDSSKPDLRPLFELEGNAVRARIEQSRGHCSRIRNIYERDLDKWFETLFGTGAAHCLTLREVFFTLSEGDTQTYVMMNTVGDVIGKRAGDILAEMIKPAPDRVAAETLARAAYVELKPLRIALQALDIQLSNLEAEFIECSGAV